MQLDTTVYRVAEQNLSAAKAFSSEVDAGSREENASK
jgi:hypothetical protein